MKQKCFSGAKGFTLAEVLVGGAIMLIAFAIFASLYQSLRIIGRSSSRNIATAIAQEQLAIAQNEPFAPGITHPPDRTVRNQTFQITETRQFVNEQGEPGGTIARISITVSWERPKGSEGSVTLDDYLD